MRKLNIDIVSDVVCPWCIIGYQSLNAAIEETGLKDTITLNWSPFELNPDMPKEGKSYLDYGRDKYGRSPEQAKTSLKHVIDSAAAVDYEINFPTDIRIYNTFNAHRLLHWAKDYELQTELKLSFFRLYFQEHGNPSAEEDLLKCVKQVGLPVEKAKEILNSNLYESEVRNGINFAHQNSIHSVPTYIFDSKYLVSGGQPKDAFVRILKEVSDELV